MTADDIRRLMRLDLDAATLATVEREHRRCHRQGADTLPGVAHGPTDAPHGLERLRGVVMSG